MELKYEKVNLFGTQKSKGTFDDFYNTKKYDSLQEAYDAKDYIECDFVKRSKWNIIY